MELPFFFIIFQKIHMESNQNINLKIKFLKIKITSKALNIKFKFSINSIYFLKFYLIN